MHISLDSELGRQRRLNQVGETISSIAAPTAAYSLRSLTGGDPKVVRVRRESDNHEQDFTASEVSSGALTSFVNAQVVAPLDIQALSATGRDGYQDFYKKNITFSVLGPVGDIIEKWTLYGTYIQDAAFGDLDFSDSNPVEITLTLRYDYAILEF